MTNNFSVTLPRLSVENRLRDLSYELGVSNAFVAALGGIQPTTLSNAYRGIKALDNEVGQELQAQLVFLMQISEALRPFTIPMTNAAETRELIHSLQKVGVTPETVRLHISRLLEGQS